MLRQCRDLETNWMIGIVQTHVFGLYIKCDNVMENSTSLNGIGCVNGLRICVARV